jgi:hypothetical protein
MNHLTQKDGEAQKYNLRVCNSNNAQILNINISRMLNGTCSGVIGQLGNYTQNKLVCENLI